MKRLFLVAVAVFAVVISATAKQSEITYVDASTLTIINKIHDTGKPLERLDVERYSSLAPNTAKVFRQSTGLALVFRTDSRNIYVRWSIQPQKLRANTPDIYLRGMDIYLLHEGNWTFAGVARPKTDPDVVEFESSLIRNMADGVKECLVYLPAYVQIESLEIGVDEGSMIKAAPSPFKHKIVFVGSSLTHGEGAPRPGANYVAQLGRRLNAETPNLGHSGQCKLQQHFVDIVCDNKADAFVFDAFSNPDGETIYSRFDEFVDIIRSTHPITPLIFLQTERQEMRNFNQWKDDYESAKQKAGEDVVRRRMKEDPHVYFIDSEGFLGDDHIGTADGTHPNDLGFTYMLDVITPEILNILEQYGIK